MHMTEWSAHHGENSGLVWITCSRNLFVCEPTLKQKGIRPSDIRQMSCLSQPLGNVGGLGFALIGITLW